MDRHHCPRPQGPYAALHAIRNFVGLLQAESAGQDEMEIDLSRLAGAPRA
jgi:hypothetical protein